MKKAVILCAIVLGLGLTACKSNSANDTETDSIMTEDTIVAPTDGSLNDTIMETDTLLEDNNDGIESKTIDISLPLYTFKNQEIHDKLLPIINDFEDNYDALEITFWPTIDTISTYGKDSLPYGYNLLVHSIHYHYHGNFYDDIANQVVGCCMIGKKFCYITDRRTRDRLFVKTSERKHHTVFSSNTVCPCLEDEAYCLLGEDDAIFYLPWTELNRGISIPNR